MSELLLPLFPAADAVDAGFADPKTRGEKLVAFDTRENLLGLLRSDRARSSKGSLANRERIAKRMNISPSVFPLNGMDVENRAPVQCGELSGTETLGTNIGNGVCGKNRSVESTDVLCKRHWLKMQRIDARGYAAQVIESQSLWDWSDFLLVHRAVGHNPLSADASPGVPAPLKRVRPDPAGGVVAAILDPIVRLVDEAADSSIHMVSRVLSFMAATTVAESFRHWASSLFGIAPVYQGGGHNF